MNHQTVTGLTEEKLDTLTLLHKAKMGNLKKAGMKKGVALIPIETKDLPELIASYLISVEHIVGDNTLTFEENIREEKAFLEGLISGYYLSGTITFSQYEELYYYIKDIECVDKKTIMLP